MIFEWFKRLLGLKKREVRKYASGNLLELYSHLIIRVAEHPENNPRFKIEDDMIYIWEEEFNGDKFSLGFLRHGGGSVYNAAGHSLNHVVEKLLNLRDAFGLLNETYSSK